MDWLMVLLVGVCAAFVSSRVWGHFQVLFEEVAKFKEMDAAMKKRWARTKAKVVRLGINDDYDYPGMTLELDQGVSEVEAAEKQKVFNERQQRHQTMLELHGGVLIAYVYQFEGERYLARDIGLLGEASDTDWVYTLKVGDVIPVWVNPDEPFQSFLRSSSKEAFDEYSWQQMKATMPGIMFATVLWLITLMGVVELF